MCFDFGNLNIFVLTSYLSAHFIMNELQFLQWLVSLSPFPFVTEQKYLSHSKRHFINTGRNVPALALKL